jgi:hypothetical protein
VTPDEANSNPSRGSEPRGARLTVRLLPEDRLLLRARAAARGMPAATYVSSLVRAHLRTLAPLPREELAELRHSIAELSAVGRSLNQFARALNQDARVAAPGRRHTSSSEVGRLVRLRGLLMRRSSRHALLAS